MNNQISTAWVLADAEASLRRAQAYLTPTMLGALRMPCGVPYQVGVTSRRISALWREHRAMQRKLRQSQPPLGLAWFIPAIAGASALVTALGAWAFKHRAQAKEVELRSELYNRMLEEGLSPEKAAALAMGAASPLTEVMGKVVILSLVLGGLYVLVKLWK